MSRLSKLQELLPWNRKGHRILERFDPHSPASGDAAVLAQLRSRGADLTRERHVIHYLYFRTDADRATAEQHLASRYTMRHGVDYGEARPKSLILERNGLVNEAEIGREREMLTRVADENHGEYDGWEASLD